MSKEYDEYLERHISDVNLAARWMVNHMNMRLTDDEMDTLMRNIENHDRSKYDECEYRAYDDYFYGERDIEAFNLAWLHHIHNNPHHWQHWLLMNDDGKYRLPGKVIALRMPTVYLVEMLADWWSFSWSSGRLTDVFDWYDEHKDMIVLHRDTRVELEDMLETLLDERVRAR